MASSAVHTFTDPDDYASSIRAANVELTITGRGRFAAKLHRIDFRNLWLQRFSDNLPHVAQVTNIARRAIIFFRTQRGPSALVGGLEIDRSTIIRLGDADAIVSRTMGAGGLAAMSLPVEVMAAVGAAITGCDLTPPKDAVTLTPPPSALARLRRLHAVAGQLAEEAPAVIAHPEAARSIEQALIAAMANCLGVGNSDEDRAAVRQHVTIMRRFHQVVREHYDQALHIPEICALIGVSERTLRVCCQEHLGTSPKRYLLLRRMNLVRRALRDSEPTATTVTEIATRYGFWQFGRFAGEYKLLFDESPSTTLARPA